MASAADIESLLSSPLSSALPLVLELCVKEDDEDILLVALDIIGVLVENGLFITMSALLCHVFGGLTQ